MSDDLRSVQDWLRSQNIDVTAPPPEEDIASVVGKKVWEGITLGPRAAGQPLEAVRQAPTGEWGEAVRTQLGYGTKPRQYRVPAGASVPEKVGISLGHKTWTEELPFASGIMGATEKAVVVRAMDRMAQNKYGTIDEAQRQDDVALVKDYLASGAAQDERNKDLTSRVTETVAQLPAFMGEMYGTAGMALPAKLAVRKAFGIAAQNATKIAADKAAMGLGKRVALGITERAAGTAARLPAFTGRAMDALAQRRTPTVVTDDAGNITGFRPPDEGVLTSLLKAEGDTFIQVITEDDSFGGLSRIGVAALGKAARPLAPIAAKLPGYAFARNVAGGLVAGWARANNIPWVQAVQRASTRAGFNGIVDEVGEEYVADVMGAVAGTTIGNYGTQATGYAPEDIMTRLGAAMRQDVQQTPEMFLAFAVPGLARLSAKMAAAGAHRVIVGPGATPPPALPAAGTGIVPVDLLPGAPGSQAQAPAAPAPAGDMRQQRLGIQWAPSSAPAATTRIEPQPGAAPEAAPPAPAPLPPPPPVTLEHPHTTGVTANLKPQQALRTALDPLGRAEKAWTQAEAATAPGMRTINANRAKAQLALAEGHLAAIETWAKENPEHAVQHGAALTDAAHRLQALQEQIKKGLTPLPAKAAPAKAPKAAAPATAAQPAKAAPTWKAGATVLFIPPGARKWRRGKVHQAVGEGAYRIRRMVHGAPVFYAVESDKIRDLPSVQSLRKYYARIDTLPEAERKQARADAAAFKRELRQSPLYDPRQEDASTREKLGRSQAQELRRAYDKLADALGITDQDMLDPLVQARLLPRLRQWMREHGQPAQAKEQVADARAQVERKADEPEQVYAGELKKGEEVFRGNEWLVTDIDAENGLVLLKDGTTLTLESDDKVNIAGGMALDPKTGEVRRLGAEPGAADTAWVGEAPKAEGEGGKKPFDFPAPPAAEAKAAQPAAPKAAVAPAAAAVAEAQQKAAEAQQRAAEAQTKAAEALTKAAAELAAKAKPPAAPGELLPSSEIAFRLEQETAAANKPPKAAPAQPQGVQAELLAVEQTVSIRDPQKSADAAQELVGGDPQKAIELLERHLQYLKTNPAAMKAFRATQSDGFSQLAGLREVLALLHQRAAQSAQPAPAEAKPAETAGPLFSDEYDGPRFTYGLQSRPMSIGAQPKGHIIGSEGKDPRFKMFGTIQYPRKLTADEVASYELVPLDQEGPPPAGAPTAQGSKNVAQRMVNAEERFIEFAMLTGDLTREQALAALAEYRKAKAIEIDPVGGQFSFRHGGFAERDVLRRAAGLEQRLARIVALPVDGEVNGWQIVHDTQGGDRQWVLRHPANGRPYYSGPRRGRLVYKARQITPDAALKLRVEKRAAKAADTLIDSGGELPTGKVGGRRMASDAIPEVFGDLSALPENPAPAEYLGEQELPGKGTVSLYNLTADIPGHNAGSTVDAETLRQAGFQPPPAPGKLNQPQPAPAPSFTNTATAQDIARARRVWQRITGSAALNIVDQLFRSDNGRQVLGRYYRGQAWVSKALTPGETAVGTAAHEAWHYTRELLLTAQERQVVDRLLPDEEAQARRFMAYAQTGTGATGRLRLLFAKLLRTIRALFGRQNAMGQLDAVFARVESGAMAQRRMGRQPTQMLRADNATITAPGATGPQYMVAAFHGTPHTFAPEPGAPLGRVKKEKVGTSEGAAAYGWGVLYTAEARGVAEQYRRTIGPGSTASARTPEGRSVPMWIAEKLEHARDRGEEPQAIKELIADFRQRRKDRIAEKQDTDAIDEVLAALDEAKSGGKIYRGNLYHVELDFDPADCLDWDLPLSQQSEKVREGWYRAIEKRQGRRPRLAWDIAGQEAYNMLAGGAAGMSQFSDEARRASEALAAEGVRGIRYADQGSRGVGTGGQWRAEPSAAKPGEWVTVRGGQIKSWHTSEAEARERADSENAKITYNYVVFNESDIRVVGRNGETLTPTEAMQAPGTPAEARYMLAQSDVSLDTHPGTLKDIDFRQIKDIYEMEFAPYRAGADARQVPVPDYEARVGQWYIDPSTSDYGSSIDQLLLLNPATLEPGEHMVWHNEEGRGADSDRYAEWLREGRLPPPINVLETEGGKLRVGDGHRRFAAALKEGRPVLALVSPMGPSPTGGREFYSKKLIGMTLTDKIARMQVDGKLPEWEGQPWSERVKPFLWHGGEQVRYSDPAEHAGAVVGSIWRGIMDAVSKTAARRGISLDAALAAWRRRPRNWKPDLKWYHAFASPLHYMPTVPALGRMLTAAMRSTDQKHRYAEEILGPLETDLRAFNTGLSAIKDEGRRVGEYLVQRDVDATGPWVEKVKGKGRTFIVHGADGAPLPKTFNDEELAWTTAHKLEADAMRTAGYSEAAANLVYLFRQMTDRAYHQLRRNVRGHIKAAHAAGSKVERVTDPATGERMTLWHALATMGNRRGYYFPRNWGGGRWLVRATKPGANNEMEKFDTELMAKTAAAAWAAKGYTPVLELSTRPDEAVFADLQVIALNDLVQKALAKADRTAAAPIPATVTGAKTFEYTRKDGAKETHLIIPMQASTEANRIIKELGAQGPYDDKQSGMGRAWHFVNPAADTEATVAGALGDDSDTSPTGAFGAALNTELAALIFSRGSRAHNIARSDATGAAVWRGYEEDPARALAGYAKAIAGGTAKREMAHAMLQAFTGTDVPWRQFKTDTLGADFKVTDDVTRKQLAEAHKAYRAFVRDRSIESGVQARAYADGKSYMLEMLRNDTPVERIVAVGKALAALKYLSGLAPAAINMGSYGLVNPAVLHWHLGTGFVRSAQLLKRSASNYIAWYAHQRFGMGAGLTDAEDQFLYHEISARGYDSPLYLEEATRLAMPQYHRWLSDLSKWIMWMGVTERINRGGTVAAAYYAQKEKHTGPWDAAAREAALIQAKRISDEANAAYGKSNRPPWARGGGVGGALFSAYYTFMTYGHNYVQLLARMGFGAKPDRLALAYMLLAPAILAGFGGSAAALAVAPVTAVARFVFSMLGLPPPPDDPEEAFYDWLMARYGDAAANWARTGLVGLGGHGVDIRGSLRLNFAELPTDIVGLLGAPAAVAKDLYTGAGAMLNGDIWRGAERMAPRILAGPSRGIREAVRGVSDQKNQPVWHGNEKLQATLTEALVRSLGFNPARIGAALQEHYTEKKLAARLRNERADVYTAIRHYVMADTADPGEWAGILGQIDKFNATVAASQLPGAAYVTPQTIRRIVAATQRAPRIERIRGGETPPPERPTADAFPSAADALAATPAARPSAGRRRRGGNGRSRLRSRRSLRLRRGRVSGRYWAARRRRRTGR